MKQYLFLLLFVSSFLHSQNVQVCEKERTSSDVHVIDVYSAFKQTLPLLPLSRVCSDIEFVPLETTDECLLDEALTKIVITSTDIIVCDYTRGYRFNRKGKFINSIGQKGEGPGEYLRPDAMEVDVVNKWVYFADSRKQRVLKYDYEGNYIGEFKLPVASSFLVGYKEGGFIIVDDYYGFKKPRDRFSLLFYSEKNKSLISRMKCEYKNKIPALSIVKSSAYLYNGDAYLKDYWSDTIYRAVSPLRLIPHAVLKKGKFVSRTTDDKSLLTGKEDPNDRMVLSVSRIRETHRYIFLSANKGVVVYDKNEGNTYAGKYDEPLCFVDDLYGGAGVKANDFAWHGRDNDIYTFCASFEAIEELAKNNKHLISNERYERYRTLVAGLTSEDNPVVMILKMKK